MDTEKKNKKQIDPLPFLALFLSISPLLNFQYRPEISQSLLEVVCQAREGKSSYRRNKSTSILEGISIVLPILPRLPPPPPPSASFPNDFSFIGSAI